MRDDRLDVIAKALATAASRRQVVRGLLGGWVEARSS
jgi:hypothetical protein